MNKGRLGGRSAILNWAHRNAIALRLFERVKPNYIQRVRRIVQRPVPGHAPVTYPVIFMAFLIFILYTQYPITPGIMNKMKNIAFSTTLPRKSFFTPTLGTANIPPSVNPSHKDKSHFGRFCISSGFLNGLACLVSA